MNKKITIIAVSLIIIITAVVYAAILDDKLTTPAIPKQQSAAKKSVEKPVTASNAAGNVDTEISALEQDLNAVTEEDFAESTLSDSELGL